MSLEPAGELRNRFRGSHDRLADFDPAVRLLVFEKLVAKRDWNDQRVRDCAGNSRQPRFERERNVRRQQYTLGTDPENRRLARPQYVRRVRCDSSGLTDAASLRSKASEVSEKWISSDLFGFHESVYFSPEQVMREMHRDDSVPPGTVIHVGDHRLARTRHFQAADSKPAERSANEPSRVRGVDSFQYRVFPGFDQIQTRERTDGPER